MFSEKKQKMTKVAATEEFKRIVDCFGFNVSEESTKRIVKMDLNNIPMEIQQEVVDSASIVEKIMKGIISFDEDNEVIVYKLNKEISTGENGAIKTAEFKFGQFTRSSQKACGIPLNQCNFSTLEDTKQDVLLCALTGVSDVEIFGKLTTSQFNDLRMIGAYFFN